MSTASGSSGSGQAGLGRRRKKSCAVKGSSSGKPAWLWELILVISAWHVRRSPSGRSGGRAGSMSLDSRNPIGVEVIGLPMMSNHQVLVRRNVEAEKVEHVVCSK